ncbi:mitotic control protein dis3 [Salpingoeca rosetta]|uniref:Ribosomal RNA-processing protein 44 n=1 Tax=Salpingoeca rosetta (strain ATCC 50818 / BSB-021) TaxID=946362 RepID=F2U2E1_SALR5|nr:mitotic control protein dis3 [Salpingoeca rosetta]EGD81793.1 mitotic control protein dis3 [Salpingoeca rosetta]|eukprot:XP_004996997.1 mitotic control protein dis3 [Salpingoeca rosetta]
MLRAKKFARKTKSGRVLTVSREHYLRDDIGCSIQGCATCTVNPDTLEPTSIILPDTNVILHQLDVLEHQAIKNVIICSTVLDEVKHRSLAAYNRVRAMLSDKKRHFYVYSNEHSKHTYVEQNKGESPNDRNDRAIRVCVKWYNDHIKQVMPTAKDAKVILLTNDAANLKLATADGGIPGYTVHEYVRRFVDDPAVKDLLAYPSDTFSKVMAREDELSEPFDAYLNETAIQQGIKGGVYLQGVFQASRENPNEGFVRVRGRDDAVLVIGRDMNRAVQGDVVALSLLPKAEWKAPLDVVEKRGANVLVTSTKLEDEDDDAVVSEPKPTGKIVGIVRRRWRPYCGVLVDARPTDTHVLFSAQDERIPYVRIQSSQTAELIGQQIVVAIDAWPSKSRYPVGHFVRRLGPIGDRETETEVVLLEHDVPYEAFSQAVLDCLPSETWTCSDAPDSLAKRRDLRHLNICSVDPPGCTDIDDALHARELDNGNYEIGVHIADVTYFVRPGSALDKEAAKRGTTVYLADRRIDMVPGLLSSNLCSLRGGEERFAFSCVWEITKEAEIVSTEFFKSIIKSKSAMMYSEAQMRIDDKSDNSELTQSLRVLNSLAKKLRRRRIERGALMLASTEVRFSMDNETNDPVDMKIKEQYETNSMVEEFMLLANVSTAEHIFRHFPQCAVLRRHPSPPPANFEPLLKAAHVAGVELSTASSKELAVSLDRAAPEGKPYLRTLLRMLATRCMMQAVYFSSGTVPQTEFKHYGLASPIYTHFTSPIRRYADVLVHRLLAASIGADITYPDLLDKDKVSSVCDGLNIRNRMAQYAARASTELQCCVYFKGRPTAATGYVTRVRKNAVQVLVPTFGVEGPVYFDPIDSSKTAPTLKFDAEQLTLDVTPADGGQATTFKVFDEVQVLIQVDESDAQRRRIVLKLMNPAVAGVSVSAPKDVDVEPGLADEGAIVEDITGEQQQQQQQQQQGGAGPGGDAMHTDEDGGDEDEDDGAVAQEDAKDVARKSGGAGSTPGSARKGADAKKKGKAAKAKKQSTTPKKQDKAAKRRASKKKGKNSTKRSKRSYSQE